MARTARVSFSSLDLIDPEIDDASLFTRRLWTSKKGSLLQSAAQELVLSKLQFTLLAMEASTIEAYQAATDHPVTYWTHEKALHRVPTIEMDTVANGEELLFITKDQEYGYEDAAWLLITAIKHDNEFTLTRRACIAQEFGTISPVHIGFQQIRVYANDYILSVQKHGWDEKGEWVRATIYKTVRVADIMNR